VRPRSYLALVTVLALALVAPPIGADAAPLVFPLLLKSWVASPVPTPTPTVTPTRDAGGVRIVDLAYDERDETVTLRNDGLKDQSLTGWSLLSGVGNQRFHFPDGYTLSVGGTVRIHSGPDAYGNPPGDLLWTKSYVWNNAGDVAVLYDDVGREVHRLGYFAAANSAMPGS